MSKEIKDLVSAELDHQIVDDVIDSLANGVAVNGKTKKPKFNKKEQTVEFDPATTITVGESDVYYALGTADVKAYYYNDQLSFADASAVAAGVFNNFGGSAVTFARGAATSKIYAYGQDVTLLDTTAGDIFAGSINKYDQKNPEAALTTTAGGNVITVANSTVSSIYAGSEGDDIFTGDVTVNVYNSKVGKIYAGGKNGAYTKGDLTVVVSNEGNQDFNGKNLVFDGAVFGTAADAKSNSWGETNVVVSNYNGAYKGAFNYVDTVMVNGDSDVVFSGAFKEVDAIVVAGGATAEVQKGGAYNYGFVLNSDTVGSTGAAMLTLAKGLNPDKVTVTISEDYANNGEVKLLSWAGYTPKKGAEAIVPSFAVANENGGFDGNGGLVADYMYSYTFDAANNLVFNYTGEAYVMNREWIDAEIVEGPEGALGPIVVPGTGVPGASNGKVFGAADDKVIFDAAYAYRGQEIDLGAGANTIVLDGLNSAVGVPSTYFNLTVNSDESKNTVDAAQFAGAVNILDKGANDTDNTVVVGTNGNAVDFGASKNATLVVDGAFTGNADFTNVREEATVKLDDGARMDAANISGNAEKVTVKVDAYADATMDSFDANAYAFTDSTYVLDLGKNARLQMGLLPHFVVADYDKNIYTAANVTYTNIGTFASDVVIAGGTFTLNNYNETTANIVSAGGNFAFNNYGDFNGTIDMTAGGTLTFNSDVLANNLYKDAVTFGGTVKLGVVPVGLPRNALTFNGDSTVTAAVEIVEGEVTNFNFNDGTTNYNGTIGYVKNNAGVYEAIAEADVAAAAVNTAVNLTNATLNIESGINAGAITLSNGKINGAFDFNTLTIAANSENTIDGDHTFEGITRGAVINVGANATLTATGNLVLKNQDNNLASITMNANSTLDARDLTVDGTMALSGTVNAGNLTANSVEWQNAIVAGSGSIALGVNANNDDITVGDINAKLVTINNTAGSITTGNITTADALVVNGVNKANLGDITAPAVNITSNANNEVTVGNITTQAVWDDNTDAIDANKNGNVALTAAATSTIVVGDITANEVVKNGIGYGAFVTLAGAGTIEIGNVTAAAGKFTTSVSNLVFTKMVEMASLTVTAGNSVTFKGGADIEAVTVTGSAAAPFTKINVVDNDVAFDTLNIGANNTVIDLGGKTMTVNSTDAIDTKLNAATTNLTLINGKFVGGIEETVAGATLVLNEATVDKVKFIGSTVQVINEGTIEELEFATNLTINGNSGNGVDTLTVGNGIIDTAAVKTKVVSITDADVVGDIDVLTVTVTDNVTLGKVKATNFTAATTDNTKTITIDNLEFTNGTFTGVTGTLDFGTVKGAITANAAKAITIDALEGNLSATAANAVINLGTVKGDITVNANAKLTVTGTLTGTITGAKEVTLGDVAAAADATEPNKVAATAMAAQFALDALNNVGTFNMNGAEVTAKDMYGRIDTVINKTWAEGDGNRKTITKTNGATITAKSLTADNVFGTVTATDDVVINGVMAGGKVEVSAPGVANWDGVTKYTKGSITTNGNVTVEGSSYADIATTKAVVIKGAVVAGGYTGGQKFDEDGVIVPNLTYSAATITGKTVEIANATEIYANISAGAALAKPEDAPIDAVKINESSTLTGSVNVGGGNAGNIVVGNVKGNFNVISTANGNVTVGTAGAWNEDGTVKDNVSITATQGTATLKGNVSGNVTADTVVGQGVTLINGNVNANKEVKLAGADIKGAAGVTVGAAYTVVDGEDKGGASGEASFASAESLTYNACGDANINVTGTLKGLTVNTRPNPTADYTVAANINQIGTKDARVATINLNGRYVDSADLQAAGVNTNINLTVAKSYVNTIAMGAGNYTLNLGDQGSTVTALPEVGFGAAYTGPDGTTQLQDKRTNRTNTVYAGVALNGNTANVTLTADTVITGGSVKSAVVNTLKSSYSVEAGTKWTKVAGAADNTATSTTYATTTYNGATLTVNDSIAINGTLHGITLNGAGKVVLNSASTLESVFKDNSSFNANMKVVASTLTFTKDTNNTQTTIKLEGNLVVNADNTGLTSAHIFKADSAPAAPTVTANKYLANGVTFETDGNIIALAPQRGAVVPPATEGPITARTNVNGSGNANVITFSGSNQFVGNVDLAAGDDKFVVTGANNDFAAVNGGAGTKDVLDLDASAKFGNITGFETIEFANGAQLNMSGAFNLAATGATLAFQEGASGVVATGVANGGTLKVKVGAADEANWSFTAVGTGGYYAAAGAKKGDACLTWTAAVADDPATPNVDESKASELVWGTIA